MHIYIYNDLPKRYQISIFWRNKMKNNGENMFTTKYYIEYFIICDPLSNFFTNKIDFAVPTAV
jgi:hypothetical protein